MIDICKKWIKILLPIFIVLFLIIPAYAETTDEGWEVDYKSTRLLAQINTNGKVQVDFVGTLSNYGAIDAPEVKIEVVIPNDGVIPQAAEGGDENTNIELFSTKAVYTITDFKKGTTQEWLLRTQITDPENVKNIKYQVKIFVKDSRGQYTNIYTQDKDIVVVMEDYADNNLNEFSEIDDSANEIKPVSSKYNLNYVFNLFKTLSFYIFMGIIAVSFYAGRNKIKNVAKKIRIKIYPPF